MKTRFSLVNSGLYPETLPPCFDSKDAGRAFRGIVQGLDSGKFNKITTDYIPYNGTKHDGSRRFFGTPNILTYFHISSFIWNNWSHFEKNYALSIYSIGVPKIMDVSEERAVRVPSLSELSKRVSENIKYAPFILKADIAQCFPSIYTHSIPWAAHGIAASKGDRKIKSGSIIFNALDFFVRNGQQGHTRGVPIGPDAYRLIAEFVLAKIDDELRRLVGGAIVGAVRHVDDYYIGLRTEHDAQSVLSKLREVLALYQLNLNDQKTQILSSLDPINDLWAQRLRDHTRKFRKHVEYNNLERAVAEAVETAQMTGSDSPIKILFRAFDDGELYESEEWDYVEQNLLRIVQKHPHAVDYACLLVAKRKAIGMPVDKVGWLSVAELIISRSMAFNHHHETVWMVWLLIVCDIEIPQEMVRQLSGSENSHIRALLVQAYVDGKVDLKPTLNLGSSLNTTGKDWLVNLVARSQGFSKSKFSQEYADEFDHLAKKNIKLLDFDSHIVRIRGDRARAISKSRYGYDDEYDDSDTLDRFEYNEYRERVDDVF